MQQITIEIPLSNLPKGAIPQELLTKASAIRFLHLSTEGFVFTCRVPKSDSHRLLTRLREHYGHVENGSIEVSREGETMIRVNGQWRILEGEARPRMGNKSFDRLKALYESQTYFLRSPEISGECLRITLVGDPKSLRNILEIIGNARLKYNVTKLCGIEKNADSPFDKLTAQQMRVLRLAYAEGYYNIPRTVSTEHIAHLLKMDKGTVGEHLRRAEKNLMDFLMTS